LELSKGDQNWNDDVIVPTEKTLRKSGGIAVLRGNSPERCDPQTSSQRHLI
jgi:dihydroxyacid dehydratase/phosphogluconate dehydratase